MSDQVGNPEDRFSRVAAPFISVMCVADCMYLVNLTCILNGAVLETFRVLICARSAALYY